jgi:large subunit ribosomal protein L20
MSGLQQANILINRKALSNLAIQDPSSFKALVSKAKEALKV